jgi:hypothetical protein
MKSQAESILDEIIRVDFFDLIGGNRIYADIIFDHQVG